MPLLTAGPSRFLGGGGVAWWLAGGTIPLANVLEHVENPAQEQLYVGAGAAGAWTVAFRTNLASLPATYMFAFDSGTGRFVIGCSTENAANGIFAAGVWTNVGLFVTGDHSYMAVSDGSAIQVYRDDVAISTPVSDTVNIGGTTRWRSIFAGGSSLWPVAIPRGMVANIALDATQRAALHTTLMA